MASNENQGLQISLIIFVMLTVVLSVTTFLFFNKFKQITVQAEKDRADASKAIATVSATEADLTKLKQWVGFAQATSMDNVEKEANADWEKYVATLPKEQRTYRAALELLANTLADTVKNLQTNQDTVQNLKSVNEARENIKDKQVVEYKQEVDTTRTDLATETTKFNQDRDRIEKEKADLAQKLQKTESDLTTFREEHDKQIARFEGDVKLLKEQLKVKDRTIAQLRGDEPPLAAGAILAVDQKRGLAWINVGEADHLPRQLSFAVYGLDASGAEKESRKGAIEVTQVLEPHLAEAKILEDEITNPIIRGDKISTPLWQPGRVERFALAGFLDIDGDGESDRVMVHDLIAMSGGLIDAELDDAGKKQGELTIDTRYLVVGKEKENVLTKVGEMTKRARDFGVEVLSLERFLDHIGWKDMKRVLRYGVTSPDQFRPHPPDGGRKTASGYTSEKFKKRQPRMKRESAFEKPVPDAAETDPAPAQRPAPAPPRDKPADAAPEDDAPAEAAEATP